MEGFTARFWDAVRCLRRVLGIGSTYTQTIQSPKQEQDGWGCGGKGLPWGWLKTCPDTNMRNVICRMLHKYNWLGIHLPLSRHSSSPPPVYVVGGWSSPSPPPRRVTALEHVCKVESLTNTELANFYLILNWLQHLRLTLRPTFSR